MSHFFNSVSPKRSFLYLIIKAFTLILLTTWLNVSWAQDPVAVLINADGDTVLSSFSDGALLAPGVPGTGSVPAEEAGTRMFWHPGKAAFRAGGVTADQWNNNNIGEYSFAAGQNTVASGLYSTAFGVDNIASGESSTAFGKNDTATGDFSTAFGENTKAQGHHSTAFGLETLAQGPYSTSFGNHTKAESPNATAFGTGTIAKDVNATAFGTNTIAEDVNSTAFGTGTTANGVNSTAFGTGTKTKGVNSTAFGALTAAEEVNSTAFGALTAAEGVNSTAFGAETIAEGINSTAFGARTIAEGFNSTAFGEGTIATEDHSLSIGRYNAPIISIIPTLFVIGNGVDDTNRSDAFRVDDAGNVFASGDVYANNISTPSDQRLKENIRPLESNTLDKLSKIRAVRYQFKDQETRRQGEQIGLIAQEVQKQFPELVSSGSGEYLSVSYNHFTAVLLKGLQEQQKQLEEKDREIRELQEKVRQLNEVEARLARLENQIVPAANDAE